MGTKIKELLDTVEEDDLYKMQMDLARGGVHLKKLIDQRIKENEESKGNFCTVCGEDIRKKEGSYTLIFGPEDFKKKAVFCELDCLQYFISGLKSGYKIERETDKIRGDGDAI